MKRIKENPITTFLGVVIILASIVSIFTLGLDWLEVSTGIAAGTGLLFAKDPGSNNSGPTAGMAAILISVLLFSCSPQKRLNRLVKKHPELMRIDTAKIYDTVIINPVFIDSIVQIDTFLNYLQRGDTITIYKDKIQTRIFTVHDSIIIESHYKGDTITRTLKVPYKVIEVKELTWYQKHLWWIILIITFILAYKYYKKVRNQYLNS